MSTTTVNSNPKVVLAFGYSRPPASGAAFATPEAIRAAVQQEMIKAKENGYLVVNHYIDNGASVDENLDRIRQLLGTRNDWDAFSIGAGLRTAPGLEDAILFEAVVNVIMAEVLAKGRSAKFVFPTLPNMLVNRLNAVLNV